MKNCEGVAVFSSSSKLKLASLNLGIAGASGVNSASTSNDIGSETNSEMSKVDFISILTGRGSYSLTTTTFSSSL